MSRTLMAAVLMLALVAVPYGAWYVTSTSKIAQDGQRRIQDTRRLAGDEVGHLAAQLALRIEQLRLTENDRPFYHYQNLYHDLAGAHEGASIVPSPLARGSRNPRVTGYFQIDAAGKVTLPTLNDEIPELNEAPTSEDQRRLRAVLQAVADEAVAASAVTSPRVRPEPTRQLAMPRSAWQQINRANELYLELRQRGANPAAGGAAPAAGPAARVSRGDDTAVTIAIGPFQWATLTIEGVPTPVALRRVATPGGRRVQGFVLALDEARQLLDGLRRSGLEVRLLPGPGTEEELAAPVLGIDWRVRINPADAIAAAEAESAQDLHTFVTRFLVSAGAAAIAAVCIVGIVWQSQGLARQRSRFASLAAHELRTPLAGLQMYGEMVAEGLGDPDNAQAYARRITDEAQRLGRVVSNMLGFSRLERGSLVVRPAFGNLGQAVAACVERQAFELEKAGATLDVRIAADLPAARFDVDALGQIVQNLLDNAEKYGRAAEDRTIHVRVERGERGVVLSVRDHGQGIDAHVQRHLFQPFARARRADAPAGIGLGLTVTRALVKAHRGQIRGENAPGGGAVFTVTFPA